MEAAPIAMPDVPDLAVPLPGAGVITGITRDTDDKNVCVVSIAARRKNGAVIWCHPG